MAIRTDGPFKKMDEGSIRKDDPLKKIYLHQYLFKKEGVELVGTELIVHTNLSGLSLIVKTKYEDFINIKKT